MAENDLKYLMKIKIKLQDIKRKYGLWSNKTVGRNQSKTN